MFYSEKFVNIFISMKKFSIFASSKINRNLSLISCSTSSFLQPPPPPPHRFIYFQLPGFFHQQRHLTDEDGSTKNRLYGVAIFFLAERYSQMGIWLIKERKGNKFKGFYAEISVRGAGGRRGSSLFFGGYLCNLIVSFVGISVGTKSGGKPRTTNKLVWKSSAVPTARLWHRFPQHTEALCVRCRESF